MKTRAALTFLFILSLIGALWLGVNLGKAQEPQPEEVQAPAEEVSVEATVASKISYQGVLKEGGNPVNGTRNLIFRLYSDNTCTTKVGSDIPKNNVTVSNGLFSVDLDVSLNHFNGQALWIEVEIGGTKLACQEILPAPYALSLIPGARMIDEDSSVYINRLASLGISPPHWGKYGTYATALGSAANTTYYGVYGNATHYGVYGESNNGTAVYAKSTSGTAIRAAGSGVIKSDATTDWVVSPLKMVPFQSTLTIEPTQNGTASLYRTGTPANQSSFLPIDIVGWLFGTRVYFSQLNFYYKTGTSNDKILDVSVRQVNNSGGYDEICRIETDLSNTSWTLATCTPSSPVGIYGSVFIRFLMYFDGTSSSTNYVEIGKMWIQLSE
ncbi:MAG: hypothetical protein DDG59_15200 [Anaerolineae bacterium]|jgi:hypothetical protein|nr:MAG: hypothetical protein DDG59_15200 [Anaerolineae bacterium]